MELDVTWKRATKVWWSYLWRSILTMIGATIIGFVVGFIFGSILGMLGVPTDTSQVVISTIGFIIGLGISIIPLKMILGKDFGNFRLVLVESTLSENTEQVG